MSARPVDPADASWAGLVVVVIGGMAGTAARLGLEEVLATAEAVLAANLLGALALGWLFARLHAHRLRRSAVWAALGPGLLGAFTTFSALQLEFVEQLRDGYPLHAFGYLAVTIGLGVPAAAVGRWIGERAT